MSMSQRWHRPFHLIVATLIMVVAACVAKTTSPRPTPSNEAHSAKDLASMPPANATRRANPVALALPLLQPRLGEPLNGLTNEQLRRFRDGRAAFVRVFKPNEGLGPIHNLHSCGGCHNNPVGGAGSMTVTMFGRVDDAGFDDLAYLGGPLLQGERISDACFEEVPPEANIIAHRITTPTLGAGLVEAIPDDAFARLANKPHKTISGRVHWVKPIVEGHAAARRAGRFGWKSQIATVLGFSASAAVNELGLTNRYFPDEVMPNGDEQLAIQCDEVADPEDHADANGLRYIDRVTDFQRLLAPPPQTPRSGMAGEGIFARIGCAACHVRSFLTGNRAGLEAALTNQPFEPYSDFLLHDMGALGDGFATGEAQPRELRTTPLWGFRIRFPVLHDGRIAGATLTERADRSIRAHAGEARSSVNSYRELSPEHRSKLIAFLDSLGRVEFDNDGDNDVDAKDVRPFTGCLNGAATSQYTPDDRCSISDIDQDGNVDLVDFALFQRAFSGSHDGSAMAVP